MGMEGLMAESRREGAHALEETQRRGDDTRTHTEEGIARAAQQQSERFSEIAREGARQTADASAAAARSGSAMADCAQEITAAWARYAEEVMRRSSEAGRALLRSRSFSEILEIQAQLLRDNMQAFLDQSIRVSEAAGRMAARPFEALRETASDAVRR
jgi:hypothetical protein